MKKKILHVLSSNRYAGAENVATSLIKNLSNEYDFAYTSPNGPIENVLKEKEINYFPTEKLSIFEIKNVIKTWRPDIIHAHDFTASIKCIIAANKLPVVSHIHQNPQWFKRLSFKSAIYLLACSKITKFVGVTPAIVQASVISPFFRNKSTVIENIVDINWVLQNSFNPIDEHFDLVFVGRLEDVKDPLRFINIVSELVNKIPGIQTAIIGDGTLRDECETKIKEFNLENNIILKGHLNNPFPFIRNSKLLVMTSKSEGLPMTIIESLALGKPTILPQLEGIKRVVDETCGVICKNDKEFINGISDLLINEELYRNMSFNAKYRAEEMCDMDKFRDKFIRVYENATL